MTGATDGTQKVTRLREPRDGRKAKQLAPRILGRLREMFREHLRGALPGLLDEMDDRLYELVERSESNQLQTHYFEVMRQLRLVRCDIERRFVQEIDANLHGCIEALRSGRSIATGELPLGETLTLVDEEEMEEGVAVKNIAAKIRNFAHEDLYALDRRVGAVLGNPELEGERNPFAPECIAGAASKALREIDTTIEVRIVLLKLTDRRLVNSARVAYGQMNELLVSLGVLPIVRGQLSPRTAPVRSRERRSAGSPQRGQGTQGEWMRTAAHSISEADNGLAPGQEVVDGQGDAASAANRDCVADGELMGVLHTVMSLAGAQAMNADPGGAPQVLLMEQISNLQQQAVTSSAEVSGGQANVLRQLRSAPLAEQFSRVDNLIIDVVAMMFDYVLDDENIVQSVRALIARLQIPTLKVAIIDKTFFARRGHPARQFVNELAALGATMNATVTRGDPAYDRIEAIVQRILTELEIDLRVFDAALEDLRALSQAEDEGAAQNAWESAQVLKERERLEQCRQEADVQVRGRLEDEAADVPAFVHEFLTGHWRHLLSTRLYQHGATSGEWRAALQIMDNLIWSVGKKDGAQDRDRLLAMLPFLLQRLKSAMEELCIEAEVRKSFLNQLSKIHLDSVRMEEGRPSVVAEVPAAPGASAAPLEPAGAGEESQPAQDPTQADVARLRSILEQANTLVLDTAASRVQCKGMGTTVVALKLGRCQALCAHVGDSRIYRLRAAQLEQLTRDHTYRQQMLDAGKVNEEEAKLIASNLITRAIGIERSVKVDTSVHELAPGDVFLLCSDGLSDMLADEQMVRLLNEGLDAATDLEALAQALVDAANEAGGRDNISVALVRVDALGVDAAASADGVEFAASHATHSGRVRAHNEDCVDLAADQGLIVLADGMGGHNAGEVASAMTVRVVLDEYTRESELQRPGTSADGAQAGFDFDAINAAFWDDAIEHPVPAEVGDPNAGLVESITLSSGSDLDDLSDLGGASNASGLRDDAAADPCLARVLKLGQGDWLEFRPADGPPQRATVSWVAQDQSRWLFTGRRGQKVAEATPHGLALELRSGRLRVLDSVPLLDRAMNHLSTRVRGSRRSDAGSPAVH